MTCKVPIEKHPTKSYLHSRLQFNQVEPKERNWNGKADYLIDRSFDRSINPKLNKGTQDDWRGTRSRTQSVGGAPIRRMSQDSGV